MESLNTYPRLIFETLGGTKTCTIAYTPDKVSIAYVTKRQIMELMLKKTKLKEDGFNLFFLHELTNQVHHSDLPFSLDEEEDIHFKAMTKLAREFGLEEAAGVFNPYSLEPIIKKALAGNSYLWQFTTPNFYSGTFAKKEDGVKMLQQALLQPNITEEEVGVLYKLLEASKQIPGKMPVVQRND